MSYLFHFLLVLLQSFVKLLTKVKLLKKDSRWLFCYTIVGKDGSPYLTRLGFPRRNGRRWLLHRWHRPDADQDLHNHPWADARGFVLLGGYEEERLVHSMFTRVRAIGPDGKQFDTNKQYGRIETFVYKRGTSTALNADTFHRVASIQPRTWTLLSVGERVQEWSFRLEDGTLVHWQKYLDDRGLRNQGDGLS